jgi:hypothetical protein
VAPLRNQGAIVLLRLKEKGLKECAACLKRERERETCYALLGICTALCTRGEIEFGST